MTISRVDSAERTARSLHADLPASAGSPASALAPADRSRAAIDRQTRHIDTLPASNAYLALVTNRSSQDGVVAASALSESDARDAAVRAKLDAVRDAFSGPYLVAGARITARPMFRMTTHVVEAVIEREVDALAKIAGLRSIAATRVGQGAPAELVKITQALIDAGRLPQGPGDVATRIRQMQWIHGIGVDCAGYSKQALLACSPRGANVYAPGFESFRDLDGARASHYAKVCLEKSRPGDLVTLDPVKPEVWGHNVVVYSHVTADVGSGLLAGLAQRDPNVRAFLASAGPHHVFEVDSSWGAGSEGADFGGFRRDTWLYDASAKAWGSFDPRTTPGRFIVSARGPGGDAYHAAYRPR